MGGEVMREKGLKGRGEERVGEGKGRAENGGKMAPFYGS